MTWFVAFMRRGRLAPFFERLSLMAWTYRIVDHGQHFVLHEVEVDDKGAVRGWVRKAIDFACDRDVGARGIIASLEEALAAARRAPVLTLDKDGSLIPAG